MAKGKSTNLKSFVATIVALIISVAIALYGIWQYQAIADYIRLFNYQPPARIKEIRSDLDLTSLGERLFYVHDPKVVDRSGFSDSCPIYEETIVLGCYFSNTSIFIFDIEDTQPDLQGVEEVTAAHEILHAAYDRLSDVEKARIHPLLYEVYELLPANSRIKRNIDEYRKQGEDVVINELHSIIATEVESIPLELEEYYSRYFNNRLIVVSLAKDYESVFESLQNQIDTFDARLKTLADEITIIEQDITSYQLDLERRSNELDALRSEPAVFNSRVEEYNSIVRLYNQRIEQYKQKIENYNSIVESRNAISAEQTTLYDAIDARTEEVAN